MFGPRQRRDLLVPLSPIRGGRYADVDSDAEDGAALSDRSAASETGTRRASLRRLLRLCAVGCAAALWTALVFAVGVSVADHPAHVPSGGRTADDSLALDHILLLGDSITAYSARTNGYANHLRNEYTTKMDTIVRGFVGLNTRDALPLILPILQSTAPASPSAHTALVIAMLGSNDATNPDIPAAHVSLPDYTRNLIHIVSAIRDTAGPATRVLLLTPPFMSVDFMMHRTRETLKQYRDACLDAARQIKSDGSVWNRVNFSVLDTWDALLGGEGLGDKPYELTATRSLFEDGLHLSAKGNAILGKAIIAKIRADWDDLRKERMSNRLPVATWMQANGKLKGE